MPAIFRIVLGKLLQNLNKQIINPQIRDYLIPSLFLNVEDDLKRCLALEVELYSKNVQGKKCLLCPFRTFDRPSRLKSHLKFHCEKNIYMADLRSPQRAVIRAYYDQCKTVGPIFTLHSEKRDFLQYSANLIMEWNNICTHSTLTILRSQNRPALVRVLTHEGPQFWAKPLTTNCIRHSSQLYYTPKFADLFLSLLLTNEARISQCVNCLHLLFSPTNRTSGLLPSNRLFWNNFT